MSKIFYYDYFALKDADIPAWHKSFFWPVARETTTKITLDFVAAYIRIFESLEEKFSQDCCIIGIMVPRLFARVVNHYLAVETLRRNDYSICCSNKLVLVPQFLHPGDNMYFPPACLPGQARENLTIRRWKNFLYSLWYNKSKIGKVLNHFDYNRCTVAFSSSNVISRSCTKNSPDWIRVLSPVEWHGQRGAVASPCRKSLKNVAEQYVDFAKNYAQCTFGVTLPSTLRAALLRYAQETFDDIAHGYSGLLDFMKKSKPRYLLTPTGGNPFTRAVSLAARHYGAHVTGFSHGYYMCHTTSPRQTFLEMATVDSFMAYTPGSVPLFKRNLELNKPPRSNKVTIEHENTHLFSDLFEVWENRPLSKKIKTVMILEFLLNLEWAGYHCAETMVNYHFYYSLCRMLSESGYEVIFKKRPKDFSWEGVNIFKDIPNIRVETRPFEAPGVIEQADAVMIQYAMSSTLFWSMCTNKTVVYVDSGWDSWFPDVYEKMVRRCRVLPCAYDADNRAAFHREDLLRVVSEPPRRPDTAYLEAYLFPETEF